MSRHTQVRTGGVNRQSSNSSASTGIHHALNVQAPRIDISATQRGLEGITRFYERKQLASDRESLREQQEQDNHNFQKGINSANSGNIDEELAENEFFIKGLNAQRGKNEAGSRSGQIAADYEEAFNDNPDLDLEEFLKPYHEAPEDILESPEALTEYNKSIANIGGILRRKHATNLAKAQDEQIYNLGVGSFDALIEQGKLVDQDISVNDFKNEWEKNKNLGLDTSENTEILVKGAIHQASKGNHGVAQTALDFIASNKGSLGKWGRTLQDAISLGKQRAAKALKESQVISQRQKAEYRTNVDRAIRNGSWDLDASLDAVEAGVITSAQHEADYKRVQNGLEDQTKGLQQIQQFQLIDQNPEAYHALPKSNQKEYVKYAESKFQGITNQFVDLVRNVSSEMSTEEKDAHLLSLGSLIQDNRQSFESMKAIGHTPNVIKSFFGSASLSSPQFDKAANFYQVIEATLGPTAFHGVPQENITQMRRFNKMTGSMGYSPEEAREKLTDQTNGSITKNISEMRSILGGRLYEKIRDALDSEDLLGTNIELSGQSNFFNDIESDASVNLTPRIIEEISLRAGVEYKYSGDAEDALETAISDFKKDSMVVRGAIISREHVPEQFPLSFEAFQEPIRDKLKAGEYNYNGDSEFEEGFTVIPIDSSSLDGRMLLVPVDDRSGFLTNKDGDLITISPSGVVNLTSEINRKKKQEEDRQVLEAGSQAKLERRETRRLADEALDTNFNF